MHVFEKGRTPPSVLMPLDSLSCCTVSFLGLFFFSGVDSKWFLQIQEPEQSAFPSSLPCSVMWTAGWNRMAACVLRVKGAQQRERMTPGDGEKERVGGGLGKESIAVMLALSQVLLALLHRTQGEKHGQSLSIITKTGKDWHKEAHNMLCQEQWRQEEGRF